MDMENSGGTRALRREKSCGAVVWRDTPEGRQYLLIRHLAGHWGSPKGHVEDHETEAETAAREIREETGLTVELDTGFRRVVTYSPKRGVVKDVIFFTARATGGTEHAQETELSELGWFTAEEAAARITFDTDRDILLAADAYLREKQ